MLVDLIFFPRKGYIEGSIPRAHAEKLCFFTLHLFKVKLPHYFKLYMELHTLQLLTELFASSTIKQIECNLVLLA